MLGIGNVYFFPKQFKGNRQTNKKECSLITAPAKADRGSAQKRVHIRMERSLETTSLFLIFFSMILPVIHVKFIDHILLFLPLRFASFQSSGWKRMRSWKMGRRGIVRDSVAVYYAASHVVLATIVQMERWDEAGRGAR